MQRSFGKMCRTRRNDSGLTLEKAAEIFGISTKSLSNYEKGETEVPSDIVLNMMDVYDNQLLGYFFMKSNDVGRRILPEMRCRQLSANILSLQCALERVNAARLDIAEIGEDDTVTLDNRQKWDHCTKEISNLISSAFSVMLTSVETEKSRLAGRLI